MKFFAITFMTLVAVAIGGPISVSDNNAGDIITVGVNANLEISNKVEQNILSIILASLSQQTGSISIPEGGPSAPNLPSLPDFITPELIDRIRERLNPGQA